MTVDDRPLVHPAAVPGWWLDHHLGDVAGATMYAARRAVELETGQAPEYASVLLARDDDHARLALDLLGPGAVTRDAVRVGLGPAAALALVLPATIGPPPAPATAPLACGEEIVMHAGTARATAPTIARAPAFSPRRARQGRRVGAAVAVGLLVVMGVRTLRSPRADAAPPPVTLEAWDSTTATATVRHGDRVATYLLGAPGDHLVLGDWDGDGARTPALYRPSTGEVWAFDRWAGDGQGADARILGTHATGGMPRVERVDGDRDTVVVDPPAR